MADGHQNGQNGRQKAQERDGHNICPRPRTAPTTALQGLQGSIGGHAICSSLDTHHAPRILVTSTLQR